MPDRDILPDIQFDELLRVMAASGVTRLLVKELAPNDNSKNQPYLSGSMDVTNILPVGPVASTTTKKGNRILKAQLPLSWIGPDGQRVPAPHAKLILYPQYPEVRFSGFLRGARYAPSSVLTTREPGRLLFLGLTPENGIIAWASSPNSRVAEAFRRLPILETEGVFQVVPLRGDYRPSQARLIEELRRIHLEGWIDSKSLKADGSLVPCDAPQCVGYTLEAELGVARNGRSEPDFDGWEIKASQVDDVDTSAPRRVLTLMTPEPTGGYYRTDGAESFVRRFGYPDKRSRPDRLNFGGRFVVGKRDVNTGLTLCVTGFDQIAMRVDDVDGAVSLVSDSGEVAAEWNFAGLLRHWNKKHARSAYVLGQRRDDPKRSYRYGSIVHFGIGTDFNLLLSAIAKGAVYYDPGIKVESASTSKPKVKKRSQFRVSSMSLPSLYRQFNPHELV